MKVGVLGTGDVGQRLASAFLTLGNDVMMGAREADNPKAQAWASASGSRASAGTFAQASEFADIVVLATLGAAAEAAIKLAGPDKLAGKVVIDATNPLKFAENAPPSLFVGQTDSLGERVQRAAPKARVIKAFNTVGNAQFFKPDFPGGPPDMFICGNDEGAKKTVTDVLRDFGWPAIDIGGIEGARVLEPLCILWVLYAIRSGSGSHAFKLLRK